MLRRLIQQDHAFHMARTNDRGVPLDRGKNERRTAQSLAYYDLVEIENDVVYLGRADHDR